MNLVTKPNDEHKTTQHSTLWQRLLEMCKKLIQETAKDVLHWKDIRTVDQILNWPCYYLKGCC